MGARYVCDKCEGNGVVRWGKCFACKGRGFFETSPEQRTKRQLRRLTSRKAGAQSENRNQSVYLGVMNRDRNDPLFMQMRVDHEAGRLWTPAQIVTARQKLRGEAEATRLIAAAGRA